MNVNCRRPDRARSAWLCRGGFIYRNQGLMGIPRNVIKRAPPRKVDRPSGTRHSPARFPFRGRPPSGGPKREIKTISGP
jgi:hypothetical protein